MHTGIPICLITFRPAFTLRKPAAKRFKIDEGNLYVAAVFKTDVSLCMDPLLLTDRHGNDFKSDFFTFGMEENGYILTRLGYRNRLHPYDIGKRPNRMLCCIFSRSSSHFKIGHTGKRLLIAYDMIR